MPDVQPEIAAWARETAGLSIETAAGKLGLREAKGLSAAQRLQAIEDGVVPITRAMLLKMVKAYRRPLLTFYLAYPPERGDRGEDFRNLPERQTAAEPLVDALIRDLRARQSMVRSVMSDEDDAQSLAFVGSMSMSQGIGSVLASIRQMLRLDLAEFRAQGSPEGAFALLRDRVESIGVFVLLVGNLGSHHSAIDASVFRGIALSDSFAPFVVINDQDAKSAWSFTLLHELTHLWLGSTGISGTFADSQTERFCNDVASNFLLPANELPAVALKKDASLDEAATIITDFATERLLSRSMVAYRLFRDGALTEAKWRALRDRFRREWLERRAAQKARDRESEGGPSYYVVRRHRLGSALLHFVARGLSEGELTPTKAGKVLGVKPRSLGPLLSGAALEIRVA